MEGFAQDIVETRNLVRGNITREYTQFVQANRDDLSQQFQTNPHSREQVLKGYHNRMIERYREQLDTVSLLGAHEGQTGHELLSFMTDLEAQLSAIDRIYGLV